MPIGPVLGVTAVCLQLPSFTGLQSLRCELSARLLSLGEPSISRWWRLEFFPLEVFRRFDDGGLQAFCGVARQFVLQHLSSPLGGWAGADSLPRHGFVVSLRSALPDGSKASQSAMRHARPPPPAAGHAALQALKLMQLGFP